MSMKATRYNRDLITYFEPLSHVSESFKIARTNIEFSSIDDPAKVIAVTSTNQGEGKTVTVANLAVSYAQIGRKVLLIDADLRRPTINRLFGVSNRRGLINALIRKRDYQDYVVSTLIDNLFILPSGPIPPNPAEVLMSESMQQILADCQRAFDLVFIDCPPVGVVTDAAIVASKVDGILYVIRSGHVEKKQLQHGVNLLRQVKAQILGYVLNGVKENSQDYYYYEYSQQNATGLAKSGKKARKGKRKFYQDPYLYLSHPATNVSPSAPSRRQDPSRPDLETKSPIDNKRSEDETRDPTSSRPSQAADQGMSSEDD